MGHSSGEVGESGVLIAEFSAKSDRKSTRLNSSHSQISYAVFCLKKKKIERAQRLFDRRGRRWRRLRSRGFEQPELRAPLPAPGRERRPPRFIELLHFDVRQDLTL